MDEVYKFFIWLSENIPRAVIITGALYAIWAKLKNGKGWIKKAIGVTELTQKLNDHLESDNQTKEQSIIQSRAILSMLRNTLRHMCTEVLKKGYITTNELETLLKAYASYKEMFGNKFIDELVDKVKELPVKDELY
jgi:tRNA U34 5-carboxymethylaminomethyl modifying GTPase MnmE/TrmE